MSGLLAIVLAACVIQPPVSGDPIAGFDPDGQVAGHWGIDYEAVAGSPVTAPIDGVVRFAGTVAGMRSVSIAVDRLRVSVSFLAEIAVVVGQRVERGELIGRSGLAHGVESVHMSVRLDGRYVDPAPFVRCRLDIPSGLRLVAVRPT